MDPQDQLSREAIDRFKEIYLEEFGEALADDCAAEMATRVLRFFDLLLWEHRGDGDSGRPRGTC